MELIRNPWRRKLHRTAPKNGGTQGHRRPEDVGPDGGVGTSATGRTSLWRGLPTLGRVAVGLEVFIAIGALYGGSQFILGPDGHLMGMPVSVLSHSPFSSFLIPGMVLFAVIGIGPLAAAIVTYRRPEFAPLAAALVGLILMGWVTVEMVMLAGPSSLLWALYLVLGTGLAALGLGSSRVAST